MRDIEVIAEHRLSRIKFKRQKHDRIRALSGVCSRRYLLFQVFLRYVLQVAQSKINRSFALQLL